MVWPMLAVTVGSSILSGMMGDKAANKQAKAQNKAAMRQNELNWLETEKSALALDAQRASIKQQSAKSLALAVRAANQARGSTVAGLAAAGIKGMTADQLVSDVNRDLHERQFELQEQTRYALEDVDQQQVNMYSAFIAGQAQPVRSQAQGVGAHAFNGLVNAAGQYAQAYYGFGAAKSKANPPASTNPALGLDPRYGLNF